MATPPTGGYHAQPAVSVPTIGEPSVVVTQTPMLPRQAPAKVNPGLLVIFFVMFKKELIVLMFLRLNRGLRERLIPRPRQQMRWIHCIHQ